MTHEDRTHIDATLAQILHNQATQASLFVLFLEAYAKDQRAMSAEIDALNTAADKIIADLADLKAANANAINPADIQAVTDKLTAATTPPEPAPEG